jgi:uncharacterized protein YggE
LIGNVSLWNSTPDQTVNVNGEATVSVVPDLLTIHFSVQTNGSTAKEAKDENAKIMDDVITALLDEGFSRDEIVTSGFNVFEEYDWTDDGRKPAGYKASHNLRIEMPTDDTEKLGTAIDAGIDNGALLNYINFELSPELQSEYKSQATVLASQNARQKAEAMAEGLGMKLGKVVSVSDTQFGGYAPFRAYAMEDSAMEAGAIDTKVIASDIQPGDTDVYASVKVVYALK